MNIKDLAIVTAGLLSDGSHTDKVVYFNNKDLTLIEHFKSSLKRIYNLEDKRFGGNWKRLKEHDIKRVYFCSKELVQKLTKFSPTFTTKPLHIDNKKIYPDCKIPNIIVNSTPKIKEEFLRMYASCDGDVEVHIRYITKEKRYDPRGNVCFIVEHPSLKKQVFEMLLSLGYSPTLERGRLRLCKKEDIIKYCKKVGFVKGCKISNSSRRVHFYWHDKNDVLLLLSYIVCFGIPKPLSKVEKSEENKSKIKKYLSSLLDKIEKGKKLDNLKHKQRRNFLNSKEKKWLLSWKNKQGKFVIYNKNKFRVTTIKIAELFHEKFGKDIDFTTVHWYWRNR